MLDYVDAGSWFGDAAEFFEKIDALAIIADFVSGEDEEYPVIGGIRG
jgi:hypothetical protein